MAKLCREVMEKDRPVELDRKKNVVTALGKLARLMHDDMRMATCQGHRAGVYAERALWLADRVRGKDYIASVRLMRECGKYLHGPEIDQLFWDLKGEVAQDPGQEHRWALEALAAGMLERDGVVKVLSVHLLQHDRGPAECEICQPQI